MKKTVIMLSMLMAASVFADTSVDSSKPATATPTVTQDPNQTIQPQSNMQAPTPGQPNNTTVITPPKPSTDGNTNDNKNSNDSGNDDDDEDDDGATQ